MRPRFSLLTLLLLVAVTAVGIRLAMWGWRHYYEEHVIPKREIAWVAYAPGVVEKARKNGRMVLLRSHAEWSITSKWMEANTFETPEVRKAIYRYDVVPILADFSWPLPHQAELRATHGVLSSDATIVYPADPVAQGENLDLCLKDRLVEAIAAAAARASTKSNAAGPIPAR